MHKCQGTSQLLLLPGAVAQPHVSPAATRCIGQQGVAPKDAVRGDRHLAAGPGAVRRRASAGGADVGARSDRDAGREASAGARRRRAPAAAAPGPRRWPRCGPRACAASCQSHRDLSDDARDSRSISGWPQRNDSSRRRSSLAHGMRVRGARGRRRRDAGTAVKLSLARRTAGRPTSRSTSVELAGFDGSSARVRRRSIRRRPLTCTAHVRDSCDTRVSPTRTGRRGRMPRATTSSRMCRSACRSGRRRSARPFDAVDRRRGRDGRAHASSIATATSSPARSAWS